MVPWFPVAPRDFPANVDAMTSNDGRNKINKTTTKSTKSANDCDFFLATGAPHRRSLHEGDGGDRPPRPKSCGSDARKSPPQEFCYVKFLKV